MTADRVVHRIFFISSDVFERRPLRRGDLQKKNKADRENNENSSERPEKKK